jgi:uncharacterized protein (TIGR02118 family)
MYKLLALYPHPTDPDHFRRYYEETHLPLALTMPGLKGHRYTFTPEGLGAASPYFCVFEGDFADKASFEASLASDVGQRTAADVANYATGGVTLLHYETKTL